MCLYKILHLNLEAYLLQSGPEFGSKIPEITRGKLNLEADSGAQCRFRGMGAGVGIGQSIDAGQLHPISNCFVIHSVSLAQHDTNVAITQELRPQGKATQSPLHW